NRLGRGIPLDRYLERQYGQENPVLRSRQLGLLVDRSPWVRVQAGAARTAYAEKGQRVDLSAADSGPAKLGHELEHHVQTKQQDGALELDAAARILQDSRLDATQKTQQAWEIFRSVRLNQELRAQLAEGVIAWELGQTRLPPEARALSRQLPAMEVAPGLTYESLWRNEFREFIASAGEKRPQEHYARAQLSDPRIWQSRLSEWSSLPLESKLTALAQLKHAPDGVSMKLWERSIADPEQRVRIEAAEKLSGLPPGRMLAAWMRAVHSQDYFVRIVALSKIGQLPRNERLTALTHGFSHRPALLMPARPEPDSRGRVQRYGEDGWSRPQAPEWASETLKKLSEQAPSQLLVKSIESLPGSERLDAWLRALNDPRTSKAAARNLEVVPERERFQAWNAAWNKHQSSGYSRYWGEESAADSVLKQIPRLHPEERLAAWKTAIDSQANLGGEALYEALSSLPAEARTDQWKALLASVKPKPPEPAEPVVDRWGWRVHRPYVPEPPSRGLARAIEALPDKDRTAAWLEVVSLGTRGREGDLGRAIRYLPPAERLGAFQLALEKFPASELRWTADRIAPEHLTGLLKTVLAAPDGELRQKILEDFPVWAAKDMPLEARQAAVADVFEQAFKHAGEKDFAEIRKWWSELPEPHDENSNLPVQPTPVRDHLAGNLDPRLLGRLIFNPGDWHVADQLAATRPEVLRTLARRLEWFGDESSARQLAPVVSEWLATGSAKAAAQKALATAEAPTDKYGNRNLAPDAIAVLASTASPAERQATLAALRQFVISDSPAPHATELGLAIAARLGKAQPAEFRAHFLEALETALQDSSQDFSWRLATGRKLAELAREGELGDINIKLPNLRMPPHTVLSQSEQAALRAAAESALTDNAALGRLMGDGPLGRLFPSVFGDASAGGMVGRPQHGGHQFPLHVHTLHVLNRVRQHREFKSLTPKEQTNLLWAALLHDSGKQAGKADPDHEWVSANLSWGVLRTLGYPPQRVQRIADLISRHGEMSFNPHQRTTSRLADEAYAKSLAVFYRHPSVIKQLRILNEADIRSIDGTSSHWTPEVQAELEAISRVVGTQAGKLNRGSIPLLTTALPERFGLFPMKGDYALLAHASPHMESAFLEQLSLIESPEFSVSASLLTPRHHRLYYQDANIVALVAGPPEHISQAYRSNLGTGRAVDWKGHVELTTSWLEHYKGKQFLTELDTRIRRLTGGVGLRSLSELWRKLAQYDTLDELALDKGTDSPYYKGQQEIFKALTTDEGGRPSKEHNEIKLNNPTLVGLGLFRRGKPVFLEQFYGSQQPEALLAGQAWLVTAPPGALVVPQTVWKAAMRRRLPLVILDP
ncbi:MAG TPA: hypothetical protein V6D08_19185, partial [Candidatus Obscuribacterales bacterium]